MNLLMMALLATMPQTTNWDGKALVTAYCQYCNTPPGFDTASGEPAHDGTCAAPKRFKFGTKILFGGSINRVLKVTDRGGAIKGNHFDMFLHSKKGKCCCNSFGVKKNIPYRVMK